MIRLVKGNQERSFPDEPQINVAPIIERLKRDGWIVTSERCPQPKPEPTKPEEPKPIAEILRPGTAELTLGLFDRLSEIACMRARSGRSVAQSQEAWSKCAGVLQGHPAFILGNGPTLQKALGQLDGYFTIGVNRIITKYDPTVLMWFDSDVAKDIRQHFDDSRAVRFTNIDINGGQHNSLTCVGSIDKPATHPLSSPAEIPVTGNSGVSAAYWAMSLGCTPIYLLGMTATYDGELTNFYGINPRHKPETRGLLLESLKILLGYRDVYPVIGEGQVAELAESLQMYARDRAWYLRQFRVCN